MGGVHADRAGDPPPVRRQTARRLRAGGVVALSVAGHCVVLATLFASWTARPTPPDPQPLTVALVAWRSIAPLPAPNLPTPAPSPPAHPAATRSAASTARPRPRPVQSVPERPARHPAPSDAVDAAADVPGLSDAALAGAGTADSGAVGGRPCNMTRRLQVSLRKDPLVQTAVAGLAGKAVMVWNGDWVWLHGEDGKGLTAVRQAMMWEIAFAPEACRAQSMHGLVIIAASETGGARVVVGSGDWRWSDLLVPHTGAGGNP
jgi:hypothetical protein